MRLARTTLVAVALLVAAAPLGAQSRDSTQFSMGKWTGTAITPDGEQVDLVYDVAMQGDTLTMSIQAGEHGTFATHEVRLANDRLTFWFQPGPRVECTLIRQPSLEYTGECLDEGGGVALLKMIPPPAE